tara:strand:- start:652 stop:1332 length:681 start_codon:yes stop_codon:yes gene_type:complete
MSSISQSQIYIGYEEREHKAYEVCESSLKRRSNIDIVKLRSQNIPEYNRDWGEPQSTDFTFTRFWIPYLSDYKGWSFFVDCDFLFLADPLEILENINPDKAVYVVKHPGYIPNSQLKMDGIPQHRAYRKNWASFILYNNEHPKNSTLTPKYLNNYRPGLDFHQFRWLDDEDIGSLPLEWNCLDDYYNLENPKAIHYTDGGPWFDNYQDTMYSDLWYKEYKKLHKIA